MNGVLQMFVSSVEKSGMAFSLLASQIWNHNFWIQFQRNQICQLFSVQCAEQKYKKLKATEAATMFSVEFVATSSAGFVKEPPLWITFCPPQ